ncbi:MAG: hypothetical protein H0W86_00130 [Armatimonadetes bacterium]|nr:hypothetical protein [Armatimonadota bacterium]
MALAGSPRAQNRRCYEVNLGWETGVYKPALEDLERLSRFFNVSVHCGDNIHPEFKGLCVELTRKMGLRYCGVDLLVIDGDISDAPLEYVIIEINAAPGIDNYAATGEE